MRIIGIDPGYDRLGLAVVERVGGHDTLIHSACIETDRTDPIPDRLAHIGRKVETILTTYRPAQLGIETLFFNKNQTTAIAVAQARGMVIYLARTRGIEVREFGPQEVKVAVTGYGKSDKAAVRAMLHRLVANVPAHALDDEYDAIAVGVTALAHHR